MNLLETILSAGNGNAVQELARNFNLDENQTKGALGALLPALTRGIKQNAMTPDGLQGLIGALSGGNHERYLDKPQALSAPETIADGNGILGHLLGSKEVSRQVAAQASTQTGVDANVLKKMLPMIAALAMGSMSKQTNHGKELASSVTSGGNSAGGLLGKLLDSDGDGSVVDDLMGMARKFF